MSSASVVSEQKDHACLSQATLCQYYWCWVVKCAVWNGSYVMLWLLRAARGTLHNSPRHSEIAALCRLWLCAAAALDEANDTADNSKIGDRSFIRSDPNPIYIDRDRFSISSKIGTFSICQKNFTGRHNWGTIISNGAHAIRPIIIGCCFLSTQWPANCRGTGLYPKTLMPQDISAPQVWGRNVLNILRWGRSVLAHLEHFGPKSMRHFSPKCK